MIKTLSIIAIVASIALVSLVNQPAKQSSNLTLNRVQAVNTFTNEQASASRVYFVEKTFVPDRKALQLAALSVK